MSIERLTRGRIAAACLLLAGMPLLSLPAFAQGAPAGSSAAAVAPAFAFDVPAQDLNAALIEFGRQSGQELIYDVRDTAGKSSTAVTGELNRADAMRRLLQGTGLEFETTTSGGMVIDDPEAIAARRARQQSSAEPAPATETALAADATPEEASATASVETGRRGGIEEVIVTAQKKAERIQDIPIAISAFSAEDLNAQKIEGGFDLLKAIPNVTFSKNNFSSYNFSIRGIGTKAISATTDPGVAVSFNNTALIQNRLFEQEYFDIERVEVLRGPQGTLYGRNATGGVINVISAKPKLDRFEGSLKTEVGNFDSKRGTAMLNVPIVADVLGVRLAGSFTNRDGYDFNTITSNPVNGRDLWSGRMTIGFEPAPAFRANFIWEHFNEDDDRSRTGKQLCHRDPGPDVVGNTPTGGDPFYGSDVLRRALFSQGCKPGSLYTENAFGTPNGLALPFVFSMLALGHGPGAAYSLGFDPVAGLGRTLLDLKDPYAGQMQSRDLRKIASLRDPVYKAEADVFELNVDVDVADRLTLSSQTAYNEDQVYSMQDFNRFNTQPIFIDTTRLLAYDPNTSPNPPPSEYAQLAPNGVFCDPQIGCSDTMVGLDISRATGRQFSQEFRLQSSFDTAVNFSVGLNYTRFKALADYYVFNNVLTAYAITPPFNTPRDNGIDFTKCGFGSTFIPDGSSADMDHPWAACPYIDPNPIGSINGEGHNYFRSKNPYELESAAAFGELYWQATEAVKVTAGLRYTDDRKTFTPVPSQILLAPSMLAGGTVNRGYPSLPDIEQHWGEWTGRLGVDWKPDLSFTDETMLYAFYSRGYKGGGANPPSPGFATVEESMALLLEQGYSQDMIDSFIDFGILPILQLTGAEYGRTFKPEYVNALEVGTKNTLFGGGMLLNLTAFYYDYKDYQVSQIRDRTAVNENFDATIWGAEVETLLALSPDLQVNFNLGYMQTRIADGEQSIDIMNRTQGNPNFVVTKPWVQLPSNCVVPTPVAEHWLENESQDLLVSFWSMCGGYGALPFPAPIDPAFGTPYDVANYPELNGGAGIKAELGGNELPNSPNWTANLGAQYGYDFVADWRATVRGDFYWQADSFARVYNSKPYDRLRSWYNLNLTLRIEQPYDGLAIEFYVKNVFDDTPITDAFLNSDDTALTTNVFTLDPRLIGLSIRKDF